MGNNADEKKYIHPIVYESESTFIDKGKLIRPLKYEERDKTVEDKIYIILYILNDADDEVSSKTFSVCVGRTMAYLDIKNKLQSGLDIDVHRSLILTETKQTETVTGDIRYFIVPFKNAISVYSFCIAQSEYFSGDEFDIEDYADGDVPEDRADLVNRVLSEEEINYRHLLEDRLRNSIVSNDPMLYNEGTNV